MDERTKMVLEIEANIRQAQAQMRKLKKEIGGVDDKVKGTGKSSKSLFNDAMPGWMTKATVATAAAAGAYKLLEKGITSALKKQTALAEF